MIMTAETTIGLRMHTKMLLAQRGKKGETFDQILMNLLSMEKKKDE